MTTCTVLQIDVSRQMENEKLYTYMHSNDWCMKTDDYMHSHVYEDECVHVQQV